MRSRVFVAGLVLSAATACTKPAEQATPQQQQAQAHEGEQKAQQGVDQMAQGLQQMAQGLKQMADNSKNGQAAQPVDFQKLQSALPTVGGWTRSEPEGRQMSMPVPVSTTVATYTKGEMTVTVTITDSAFNQLATAPLTMMTAAGYSEKTATGFKRATMIGGSPGYEEWDGSAKTGNVGLIAGKRFMVGASGSHLDSLDSVKAIVQKIDVNSLAGLK